MHWKPWLGGGLALLLRQRRAASLLRDAQIAGVMLGARDVFLE